VVSGGAALAARDTSLRVAARTGAEAGTGLIAASALGEGAGRDLARAGGGRGVAGGRRLFGAGAVGKLAGGGRPRGASHVSRLSGRPGGVAADAPAEAVEAGPL